MKEREKKILEYMKAEIREKGYPPTVREICSALGIKSTSTVHKDIASLEREGYLKKDPARPRALLVVDDDLISLLQFALLLKQVLASFLVQLTPLAAPQKLSGQMS